MTSYLQSTLWQGLTVSFVWMEQRATQLVRYSVFPLSLIGGGCFKAEQKRCREIKLISSDWPASFQFPQNKREHETNWNKRWLGRIHSMSLPGCWTDGCFHIQQIRTRSFHWPPHLLSSKRVTRRSVILGLIGEMLPYLAETDTCQCHFSDSDLSVCGAYATHTKAAAERTLNHWVLSLARSVAGNYWMSFEPGEGATWNMERIKTALIPIEG